MGFITENLGTILISAALIAIVVLAIRSIRKSKAKGGCSGCSGCSQGDACDCHHTSYDTEDK